jgi:hypothetical protein
MGLKYLSMEKGRPQVVKTEVEGSHLAILGIRSIG